MSALLYFGGHLSSSIALSNIHFEASLIEMEFEFSNVTMSMLESTFTTGIRQMNAMSICIARGTASLIGEGITTSQFDIELQAPRPQYCSLYSTVVADVSIYLMTSRIDTLIANSDFSHKHGMAFHYQLGTSAHDSYLNAAFENTVFQNNYRGAIAFKFLTFAVRINVRFMSCIFENNSFISTNSSSGSGASGVQIIYPLYAVDPHYVIDHTVKFQGCLFRHNTGQVILLYKSKNVTFIDCIFAENNGSSIVAFHTSYLFFSGQMNFFNNSAYRGSGLVLTESTLYIDFATSITFYGNTASNKGGAILVEGQSISAEDNPTTDKHCFYQITRRDNTQKINFTSNFAALGGHDIYGSPLASYCLAYDQPDHQARSYEKLNTSMFHFQPKTLSSITSDPQRVCLCSDSNSPSCKDVDMIFSSGYSLYPGEVFSLSVAVVSVEFGTVAGVVQASLVLRCVTLVSVVKNFMTLLNCQCAEHLLI